MEFAWNFPVSKALARGRRGKMPTCQTPTRFCGNYDLFLTILAINVGSVDEIYATIDRFV